MADAPLADVLDSRVLARLADLADQWALDRQAVSRLGILLGLISQDPTAPTSVRDPAVAIDVHVADSLTGLSVSAIRSARTIADIGAGAGFPGLPLAIASPYARVALVESNARKAEFMRRVADDLSLPNADVIVARAEGWYGGAATCDVVTARALAELPILVEYAAPLLKRGGVLVAWKGRRDANEEARGAAAAEIVGLRPGDPVEVRVGPLAAHRHLHVYEKVAPTPAKFPRRPGIAAKRPLA